MQKVGLDVSRETNEMLHFYLSELEKWSAKINLVAPSTLADGWQRHIVDSAQLFDKLSPEDRAIVDFGSGGGTPALVLAIMSLEVSEGREFTLIESDQRKAVFLREIIRQLGLNANVIAKRIETLPQINANVVTARAFAPVDRIFDLALTLLGNEVRFLLPKGARAQDELARAKKKYLFNVKSVASITDPDGVILEISGLEEIDG